MAAMAAFEVAAATALLVAWAIEDRAELLAGVGDISAAVVVSPGDDAEAAPCVVST